LFGYAQLLLPDSVAAAEVVDSVLEAAAERDAVRAEAGALPPGGDEAQAGDNLRALMYAAVRRECRKRRLVSGWAAYASEPEVLPAKVGAGGLGPENIGVASISAVQRYLQAAAMTQVLAGLPERQREMLNLAFWHGLSPDELGTIFAIPARLAEKELASACARFASLVAVVVLLQSGRSDCPELDAIIVGSFAQTPGYELCREVGTHSLECATCSETVASRGLGPLRVEDLPTVDLNPDLDRRLASFAQSLDPAPRAREPLWGGRGAAARSGAARLGQNLLRRLDPPADGKSPSPPAWQGRARLLGAAASALAVVGIVAGVMVLGKFTITPATEADGSSAVQLSGAPSRPGGAPGSGQAGQFQIQRPGSGTSPLPIFTSPGPPSMSSSPPAGTQPSSPAPTPSRSSSPTKHTKSPKPSRSPSSPPPPPPTSPPPFSSSPPPTSSSPSPDPSSTAPAPAQSSATGSAGQSSPS
jgi:hypothetical protein